jgi:sugar O-acyltransferase (sialic acid O-acetyltransferase NeuD family)
MKKALIGGGGHTREVMCQIGEKIPIFVDDKYYEEKEGYYKLSDLNFDEYEVMVCVGDSTVRKKIVESLPLNSKFFTFIHPSAIIMDSNISIGEGSFIGAYSILTTNIKIGKHSILNRACHIGHDSQIGDYLSMMPSSIISGNVSIGDCVFLGTNSSIREKSKIGDNIILGMGSVTLGELKESGIYVGIPSKLKKKL